MKKYPLIVAVLIICLSGCVEIEEKAPIKIGLNAWPGYIYAYVAKEEGFFDRNGVNVELVLKDTITESNDLYFHDEVDGICTVFADTIMFASQGRQSRVVYVFDYSESGDVIVANRQIHSLADLKGKTVSFEGVNTFSHLFVIKILEQAGLSESDLQFKLVSARNVLRALTDGEIDAGHSWEPMTSQVLAKGYKVIASAADIPNLIADVLVFDNDIVKHRPRDIGGIVKSLVEAKEFFDSNQQRAVEIMTRATGMEKEVLVRGIKGVHLLNLDENIRALGRNSQDVLSLYTTGHIIADFYAKHGQLVRVPDFNKIIDLSFVQKVKEERLSKK